MNKNGLLAIIISSLAVIIAGFIVITLLESSHVSERRISSAQPVKRTPSSVLKSKFDPDVEIQLTAKPKRISVVEGKPTEVWSYEGILMKGDSSNLIQNSDTYLGPTITVRTGQKVRIYFKNEIPEKSVIHWHGLHVAEDMDGHPRYAIDPGETYIYEFEIKNRAGTYLYHPHPHGVTGKQVYFGLAGLFIIKDDEEKALNLPAGEYDIPLVIQDRRFNADGSLNYATTLRGSMMDMMEMVRGFLGDVILVNGKPDYAQSVKTAKYRLRLANVSNSRIYKLYLNDGSKFMIIGTDGGLLEAPVQRSYIVLSPGERAELIMDFSVYNIGDVMELKSAQFQGGAVGMVGQGMMGRGTRRGMMGSWDVSGGEDFKIAQFVVSSRIEDPKKIPAKLSHLEQPQVNEAINKNNPRRFIFEMGMMRPTINGRSFQMEEVAHDEIVTLNTTEVWEIINSGHMPMPHPIHIHGLQFRIIERRGSPDDLSDGYIDTGWKDTFLLMPGERVRVLIKFEDFTGMYLYHCHNLEHSDMGMMRNYKIAK